MINKLKKARYSIRVLGTIRSRLLITSVLIVLLAAIAISGVTVVLGNNAGKQREIDQLESVVTLKQAEIRSWVKNLRINLDLVSSDQDNMNDILALSENSAGTEAYEAAYNRLKIRFNWAAGSMGLFDELFLMDVTGKVLFSTNSAHENEKHSIYDYFIQGLKGAYIQQPSYSLALGRMTIVTSAPITFNGLTVGVVAGRASLQSLNDIMIERSGLGATGETYLVGSNHRLLTELRNNHFLIPDTYIRTMGGNATLDEHLSGSAIYPNYDGKTVIGVYRWLPDLQVALLAEQEQSEALHATSITLMIIGGVALAALVLAILAVTYLTRSIVKPLAGLALTASKIAEGDLEQEAQIVRDDEVGTVARAFNSMTHRLRGLVRNLEKRTDQLRAINETGRHISSILHPEELLNYVASILQKTFQYRNVGIIIIDQSTHTIVLKASAGAYEGGPDVSKGSLESKSIVSAVIRKSEAVLVNNIRDNPEYRDSEGAGRIRSELAVPIKLGEKVLGVLDIESEQIEAFDDLDLFTAQTLADQLAITIENARLYEQAQELAVMKERQRLARDLHDAVSQTLFSASLIAEVLPRLWERNPEEGRKRLEEVRQLTRGALAEMRTLLLELRPAALVDADLGDLLRQLSESISGRSRIQVSVNVQGAGPQNPELKVALYRIAQEALNNVAKHSQASEATVILHCQSNKLELIIRDNGKGFDLNTVSPTSLGVGIMNERARGIGATIKIESHPDQGTSITVEYKINQAEVNQ